MPSTIRDLTELTVVASDDYILISDTSDVVNRDKRISKINFSGGLMSGGGAVATGGFTLTVPATGTAVLKAGTPIATRVAMWTDANQVQATGFASTDVALLSVAQSYTALPTFASGIRTGSATLNDQTFIQFTPPAVGGIILVWCDNSALVAGMANFRRSGYITTLFAGTNLTFQTGTLNGSTGVNGKATVGNASDIYIENRLGAARTFYWMLFL